MGTIHEDLCTFMIVSRWTYLLTYSMVQSSSWEADWFAVNQEIPRISRNPKVHYRTHKRPPPVPILGQPNPVHIPTSHLLEIHPNIIHPSTPRSRWTLLRIRSVSDKLFTETQNTHFMLTIFFLFRKLCHLWDRPNVEKYGTAGQATDDSKIRAHALCVLDKYGCRHTLRICNTYCISTTTTLTRTRLNITFICTLSVMLFVRVLNHSRFWPVLYPKVVKIFISTLRLYHNFWLILHGECTSIHLRVDCTIHESLTH